MENLQNVAQGAAGQPPVLRAPTCGRIVHWFRPESLKQTYLQDRYPAVVIDGDDTYPTLGLFSEIGYQVIKTVPHQTLAVPEHGYWAWPEVK